MKLTYGQAQLKAFTSVAYILLRSVGAIPYTTDWKPTFNRNKFIILWTLLFFNNAFLMVGEHITFWTTLDDPEYFKEAISLVMLFIYGLVSMSKTGCVIYNHNRLTRLMVNMEKIYPTTPDEQRKFGNANYDKKMLRRMKYFGLFQVTTMWSFALYPLIDVAFRMISGSEIKQVNFPLGEIYVPYNHNVYVFPFVYILHVIAINYVQFSIAGADLLLWGLIIQLCNHFDYLSVRLVEINPNDGNHKDSYDKLSECIKRHQKIIHFSSEIDEIFSATILHNLFSSSLVLCLLGFLLATTQSSTELTKYNVHTIFSPLFQAFIICWLGEKLSEHSTKTYFAAYSSAWYNADQKFKRRLIIMIQRAQSPQFITAYKFSVASLPVYSSILSTSWSYLMLLLTLYKSE